MSILNFNESQFINFSYMVTTLSFLLSSLWRYSTIFSSRNYVVLYLDFVSTIHLIFISYVLWRKGNWMGEIPHFKNLSFPCSVQILLTIFSNPSIYFSFFSTIFSCPSSEYCSKQNRQMYLDHLYFFCELSCSYHFSLFIWL